MAVPHRRYRTSRLRRRSGPNHSGRSFRNHRTLGLARSVVEVHCKWGIAPTAVAARHSTHCVQHPSLASPPEPTASGLWGIGSGSCRQVLTMRSPRPPPMADGADDVALGDLGFQHVSRGQHGPAARQLERLRRWIAMVEIHLIRRKRLPTVGARLRAELAEERQGRVLPSYDAGDLALTVQSVIPDVLRPLVSDRRHIESSRPVLTERLPGVSQGPTLTIVSPPKT